MIKVFYRSEQTAMHNDSFSPSAGKPAKVVSDWMLSFAGKIDVTSFAPVTVDDLALAHKRSYVQGVLNCTQSNGFGNTSKEVAASLPYTSGSMLAAAIHVLKSDDNVACSPTSGFHHAYFESGGGYCTFNGLMVTAIKVQALGLAKKVLILDYDMHWGDGTDDIVRYLGLDWVTNVTNGKQYREAQDGLELLDRLEEWLVGKDRPDLVLYQAGADIHVDDPLGGIMTTEQMRERDRLVFSKCKQAGVPLVWNLAGGYNVTKEGSLEPVLKLHRNTMDECINQYLN